MFLRILHEQSFKYFYTGSAASRLVITVWKTINFKTITFWDFFHWWTLIKRLICVRKYSQPFTWCVICHQIHYQSLEGYKLTLRDRASTPQHSFGIEVTREWLVLATSTSTHMPISICKRYKLNKRMKKFL